jgi:hypothetical protein
MGREIISVSPKEKYMPLVGGPERIGDREYESCGREKYSLVFSRF